MSGCPEGILVDLSEPLKNSPVKVTDSIEFLREAPPDCFDDGPKFSSPLKNADNLVLDISTKSNTSEQLSPLRFIDAETFDFDLPVTPSTNSDRSLPEDEEEEVFFGPMGYRERCVSSVVNSITKETKPLSPLNPRQIAEICKEANAVACRISSAASGKKSTKMPKQNLFCVKQLNLGQSVLSREAEGSHLNSVKNINTSDRQSVLSREAEGSLLNSVKNINTFDDREENKENCDNQAVDLDTDVGSMKSLEAFLKGDVTVSDPSTKSNTSESETSDFSSKKHNRIGTYTLNESLLPADKRKSLPVVGNVEESSVSKSGEKERRSLSKLKQPASKLTKSLIPGMNGPNAVSVSGNKSTTGIDSKLQTKSRLPAPKTGSLLPSKLKPVGTCTSSNAKASNIPAKAGQQLPQKTALPGFKGRGAPMSKLQLMKPCGLQKPGSLQVKASDSTKKNGPMKAYAPVQKQEVEKAPTAVTPTKQEKQVNRKNLSSSFSSPSRSGSTSSVESPASAIKRRRSFLPTPSKSRKGSNGSVASPCPSGTSSTSSYRSIESPLVKGPASGTRGSSKFADFDHMDDSSPSAMRPKRELVTNTPNLPKKKLSQWSPVQRKKPHDLLDQAIMCTKKFKK